MTLLYCRSGSTKHLPTTFCVLGRCFGYVQDFKKYSENLNPSLMISKHVIVTAVLNLFPVLRSSKSVDYDQLSH
jgi:hypothetical protein